MDQPKRKPSQVLGNAFAAVKDFLLTALGTFIEFTIRIIVLAVFLTIITIGWYFHGGHGSGAELANLDTGVIGWLQNSPIGQFMLWGRTDVITSTVWMLVFGAYGAYFVVRMFHKEDTDSFWSAVGAGMTFYAARVVMNIGSTSFAVGDLRSAIWLLFGTLVIAWMTIEAAIGVVNTLLPKKQDIPHPWVGIPGNPIGRTLGWFKKHTPDAVLNAMDRAGGNAQPARSFTN